MTIHSRLILTCICLMTLLAGTASAQPATGGGDNADVMQAIGQLRAELPAIVKREVDASMRNVVTQDQLGAEVQRLTDLLEARELELRDLKADVESNKQEVAGQIADQRRILDAISTPDSQGNRMLALNNMMSSSPQFRGEMSQAVNASIHRRGTLRVTNRMGTYQTIEVDGTRHWLAPNQTVSVGVDVGTVTTHLVGYEPRRNWTVGAPNYEQDVIIRPSAQNSVAVDSGVVYPYPAAFVTWP